MFNNNNSKVTKTVIVKVTVTVKIWHNNILYCRNEMYGICWNHECQARKTFYVIEAINYKNPITHILYTSYY